MSRSLCEMLEGRYMRSLVPVHVELGRRMVSEITPANNIYSYSTPVVTWAGINGATKTYNKSDCSSFTTKLLQTAYGYTNGQFTYWTGESDPEAEDYYAAALANKGFTGFKDVDEIIPGDLFIMKYIGSSDTGHVVTLIDKPSYVKNTGTELVYTLHVLDCTSSPHGSSDTRYQAASDGTNLDGVGEGYMRIYTDMDGVIQRYSWNNYSNGTIYDPATRLPLFAHTPRIFITVVPEPGVSGMIMAVGVGILLRRSARKMAFSQVQIESHG